MLWMQAHGTLIIGTGLALTGLLMIAVLGTRMLEQPWLLVSLLTYAITAVVAFAVQRPSLVACLAARASRPRRTARRGAPGPAGSGTSRTASRPPSA